MLSIRNKSVLFIISICYVVGYANNDLKKYDLFFYNLKNLEYEKATEHLKSIDNDNATLSARLLVELLYDAGQTKKEISYKNDIEVLTPLDSCINLLLKGYENLYYHSTEVNAYQYFSKGYVLAKRIGYRPLTKQYLLGLLELYHSEILQSNQQYITYLLDFEKLIEDDVDRFWHLLYTSILNTKTINNINQLHSDNLNNLSDLVLHSKKLSKRLLTKFYYEKAIYYGFDQNFEEAEKKYNEVIPSAKLPFMKYMVFGSYIRLAVIQSTRNKLYQALESIDSASVYKDNRDTLKSLFYIYRYKSKFYAKSKKYDSAYILMKKSLDIEYKLQYRKNTIEISRMNVLYETEKKERQLLEEQQRTKQNKNFLLIAIVIIVLGSLVAILLQKNTSKKQLLAEQQQEMQKQKVETLLKEQELLSIDAMIVGQEKERLRMANELHDDLGSLMATIKLHFDNIKVDKEDTSLKKADKLLEKAYQKIRGIAHSKNSGVIGSQGLIPAIRKMSNIISQTNKIELEVFHFGLDERLENSLELTIFRIIQELITNIIKHAEATKGTIQLTQYEESLNIMIEDNGKGFRLGDKANANQGMGLTNIEKRIEYLEGSFTVDSILERSTTIIIDIPL